MFLPTRYASTRRHGRERGFTLIELMITLTVLAIVMGVLMTVMYAAVRSRTSTVNHLESAQAARAAVDMMARDLRSAGYGSDYTYATPQPAIAYIDSQEVILSGNFDPYPDSIGTAAAHAVPRAYDPAIAPNPRPLVATQWTPPIQYRTGAELVRWTLDANNDGVVDQNDLATALDADARTTRNPSDYVLLRQSYGDLGNGSNNGTAENIALVSRPGGPNPPMFRVYMKNSTTPWDWATGPVPAAQLANIERIEVAVAAPSGRPDQSGQYATTVYRAQVNSLRNTPDFGAVQYSVDGYVYNDANRDSTRQVSELGIPNVQVWLSGYSGTTDANGHFLIRAPAGNYTLYHTPKSSYGAFSRPSYAITLGPATTRSFADTVRTGGWVHIHTYDDANKNGSFDTGEADLSLVRTTISPSGAFVNTGFNGLDSLWASPGSYSVVVTPPDSFVVTSTNPVSGVMVNGGSTSHDFGLTQSPTGTIKGKVWQDTNRDGTVNGSEGGKPGVWVGVSPDGGSTVLAWQLTDASGNYSLTVPINQPPGTQPYSVYIVVPPGFFPTTTTAISPIMISQSQVLPNNNFGVDGFQRIQLSAQRVLSLANGDLVEKDWNGNTISRRAGDNDLVLGADAAGTDQISVWFNQYDNTPIFNTNRDYSITAAQAVLCLAVDTLDAGAANLQAIRKDVVTGTKYAAAGNFFVWLTQNTSNEGFLPATPTRSYKTADNGDVTAVITGDMTGPSSAADLPDILVGTKSPIAGQGTLELWQNSGGTAPTWSRVENYPDASYTMGEVVGMARADLDNDGIPDLAVACRTTTGSFTGEVLLFKGMSKTTSPRFQFMGKITMLSHQPTCIGISDVNADGWKDILVGDASGIAAGDLRYYQNMGATTPFAFTMIRTVSAPGPVQCLTIADFGGSTRSDVAIGWRADTGSYNGGVLIYFTDLGTIPVTGIDPSGGAVTNWCAALTANHFNWGLYPAYSGSMFIDLAVGVKTSVSGGALWVFIR